MLENFVILDVTSGTYFNAFDACLIDWQALSPEDREVFVDGTDTDRLLIADKHAQPLKTS